MNQLRWSQDEARDWALLLPEAQLSSHMGRPDLRVRSRIFATLPQDGGTVNVKTTPIGLDMLVRDDPATYRDVWGGRWVGVDLARVSAEELRELLIEAYCLTAPHALCGAARTASRGAGPSAFGDSPAG